MIQMKHILSFIVLALFLSLVACDSSDKKEEQKKAPDEQVKQKPNKPGVQSLTTTPDNVSKPASGPTPEIDNKSLKELVHTDFLQELLEVPEADMMKMTTDKDGNLTITWPNPMDSNNPAEFKMTRVEAFEGTIDDVLRSAQNSDGIFYDDIGGLGGYYKGGEDKTFYFPLGGFMYGLKIPEIFPEDLIPEKGHQMALRIWERNQ